MKVRQRTLATPVIASGPAMARVYGWGEDIRVLLPSHIGG